MIKRKLRSRKGMTLAETLVALAVFAILSVALVIGTTAAWKVYRKAVVASEARILRSTIIQALTGELRYVGNIQVDGEKVSFDSETFGMGVSVTSVDGRILIGKYELLPEKAYSKGLKADVKVSCEDGFFKVDLTIRHELLPDKSDSFTIRALNAVDS